MNKNENFIIEKNTIDGTPVGGFLRLDCSRVIDSIEFMRNNGVKNLGIDRNQKIRDLNFLKGFSFVEGLQIDADVNNLDGIYFLGKLKFLLLGQNMVKHEINFDSFKYLEYCIVDWNRNTSSIVNVSSLLRLSIYNFSELNLKKLNHLGNLTDLFLSKSKLKDLSGIENLKSLEKLNLYYLSNLEKIEGLKNSSNTLIEVCFNNCKKIKDFENISLVKNLDKLCFNSCGEIRNLHFLSEMDLKEFRFVGTNVIDGDLSYLKNIDTVIFSDKKHYSHTFEELNRNKYD